MTRGYTSVRSGNDSGQAIHTNQVHNVLCNNREHNSRLWKRGGLIST